MTEKRDTAAVMDAVTLEREGGPLTLRPRPRPEPGPGQVLIRVAAAPINPSDVGFVAGTYAARALPAVPGFEGAGTVVAAGRGLVPRLLVGRPVAFASGQGGSWAEYCVTASASCVPVGRDVPLESAATLIVNPLTALAFFDMARSGRHAAMVSTAAASALGRMVLRLGHRRGVPVVNVVRRPEQAALLEGLGARHVLVSTEADFPSRLEETAHRLRATLLLDAVGGDLTRVLIEAAPRGSTLVAYSALAGAPSVFPPRTLIADEKRIEGFYLAHWAARKGLWRTLRDVRRVRRLAATDLGTAVRARFPLAAAQEALDTYRADMTAGKVLLVPGPAR